jgi:hypothetical protein
VNEAQWKTQFGETISLREMARRTARLYRRTIRRYSDPFSFSLLLAIMKGRAPSLLELVDRPAAYEDVGLLCRWGSVIHELKNYESELGLLASAHAWQGQTIDQFVLDRQRAREKHETEMANVTAAPRARTAALHAACAKSTAANLVDDLRPLPLQGVPRRNARQKAVLSRRRNDRPGKLIPRRPSQYVDRRGLSLLMNGKGNGRERPSVERRKTERRKRHFAIPFPDRRLARSAYEQVFLKLVSGGRLRVGNDLYTPIAMKGWYHAVFRRESDGAEKLLTIDQLLKKMNDWT